MASHGELQFSPSFPRQARIQNENVANPMRRADYDIRHDDLPVTIDADALAAFYTVGERTILDHSPEVLGLREI
ncbi:MAG: hypothetical protein WEE89_01825 [Gemmatimonadota bacterium]